MKYLCKVGPRMFLVEAKDFHAACLSLVLSGHAKNSWAPLMLNAFSDPDLQGCSESLLESEDFARSLALSQEK